MLGGDLIGYLCRLVCRWMLRGQPVTGQESCPEEDDGEQMEAYHYGDGRRGGKDDDRSSTWSTSLETLTLPPNTPSPTAATEISSHDRHSSPGVREELPLPPATSKISRPKWLTNLKAIVNNAPQKVPQSPPISNWRLGSQKVPPNSMRKLY